METYKQVIPKNDQDQLRDSSLDRFESLAHDSRTAQLSKPMLSCEKKTTWAVPTDYS